MVHCHHRPSYQWQQLKQHSPEALEELHHLRAAHLQACYYYYYYYSHKRWTSAVLRLVLLVALVCFSFILAPRFSLTFPPAAPGEEPTKLLGSQEEKPTAPCSSMANGTICCDRTAFRTDVCYMRGDVRTHAGSNSILLVSAATAADSSPFEEKIRPYTRKWETRVMSTVDELRLRTVAPDKDDSAHGCDVRHDVPAVIFSTGGYTGNLYHEFNDGIIPLYITSHHLNGKVAFVILEYHDWWVAKYGDVLAHLSDYPLINFARDRRTHCFPEVVVGLRIHDELSVDPAKMANNETIGDFRRLLDDAYGARVSSRQRRAERDDKKSAASDRRKPKVVVLSRNGSRAIKNERQMVKLAKDVGFEVQVLRPNSRTELSRMYQALNSCDAMLGVHGAAMTHLLFMRPGAVLVQIVPLGTDWAADAYYGAPAMKMGLRYMAYKILPGESSLSDKYGEGDLVLTDPEIVNSKGWQFTKKVYLDGQTVRLDLARFREHLVGAHRYLMASRWKKKAMELRSRRPQLHIAAKGDCQRQGRV